MIAACIIAQTSSGSSPGGSAPVASFSIDTQFPAAGEVLIMSDTSSNNPTQWAWTINGTLSSIARTFGQYFSQNGWVNIGLTVTNQFGSDSTSQQVYVSTGGGVQP